MSGFISYIRTLLQPKSDDSIKSFAMFISVILTIILTLCLGTSMIIDVCLDGSLQMSLIDAGVFVSCLGSFITLSALPKAWIDHAREIGKKKKKTSED